MTGLTALAHGIDRMNEWIGRTVSWLAVILVLVQFTTVVMRYMFGTSSIILQDSLKYIFASMFMFGAGFALLHDAHVRVDIFYRDATVRTKAWVNLLGAIIFLIPTCIVIWYVSKPYVDLSWFIREGSRELSGIHAIYLLKTQILIFAVLVGLQGVSMVIHALLVLSGEEKPHEEHPQPL